jgi:AbrB family looped-hinge helix DNA binding protein
MFKVWHNSSMSHKRYRIHVGERGRFVLPAALRRRLGVDEGDLLLLEVLEGDTLRIRKAADVAAEGRGLFRELAPELDLAAELVEDRRAEAERETAAPDRTARR